MNMIAAVDKNWGIGKDNELLDHIPEDMKFFRQTTTGKAVIMGKNTLLSFPGQKPLPNRLNIVLTHDKSFSKEGAVICHSVQDAVKEASQNFADEDIFVIGGAAVYAEMEPLCKTAYITKIDKEYQADKFLVSLDKLPEWKIESEERVQTEKGLYITFTKYVRQG
ncbi:MAG: dihydrofolate reductase [Clostridia bacterium]|nr:dihydrofolate reductase [Clostridia bacterium]